jgi:hypothetical protein
MKLKQRSTPTGVFMIASCVGFGRRTQTAEKSALFLAPSQGRIETLS